MEDIRPSTGTMVDIRPSDVNGVRRIDFGLAVIRPAAPSDIIAGRMRLAAGTKLGPYQIIAPVGAGGMGEVYSARDSRLDRTVAVKVLKAPGIADPSAKERFDREARIISSLNHPHICHIYDVGQQAGPSYLVMEYLEGQTLADRLLKGALPLDQVLKVGVEICDALERAHSSGVVHRDLKPGNIVAAALEPRRSENLFRST